MRWCLDLQIRVMVLAMMAWRCAAADLSAAAVAEAASPAAIPAVVLGDAAWRDLSERWDAMAGRPPGSPIENLALPLEHHDNGRVRAMLHAGTAILAEEPYVCAWQVRVELFTAEGKPDGKIEAACGLFDRATRRGYCRGAVSFTREDARVKGVDLYWSAEQQQVRILSQGEVRARGLIVRMGGFQ
jgi:hypothetical protein